MERFYALSPAFQSTLPARGATTDNLSGVQRSDISIHAPRTGSDFEFDPTFYRYKLISIHAPRTGSDFLSRAPRLSHMPFQSTLPARGATVKRIWRDMARWHFNPRSPHGERPPNIPRVLSSSQISIHAPRTGSDTSRTGFCCSLTSISIHAPRTGSDWLAERTQKTCEISIHAPRTGSDRVSGSTKPVPRISIHAPRTGSDCRADRLAFLLTRFQSTLPARGAT